jgi:hypothetical protein
MNLYQLEFSNGKVFNKVFQANSKADISDYVLLNFYDFRDDLRLSENYSCNVNLSHDKNKIIISGDEDYCEITIKEVDLIKL